MLRSMIIAAGQEPCPAVFFIFRLARGLVNLYNKLCTIKSNQGEEK